jgi:L-threonine-O-3-phosphate decarboxylase
VQEPFSRPTHGGNLVWAASLAGCSPSAILDFSASINPLGPPQSAITAITANLTTLCHYPDPEYRQLREALSQQHQLPIEWILAGNGSAELLTWACRELANLQATYLFTPAFADYRRALRAFDATVVACPLTAIKNAALPHFELATPAFEALPSSCGLLLNNPHNPTGKLFTITEILPLLARFSLIVIDEAFMDFLPAPEQQSLIDAVPDYPNLVILRSLTKFYSLPGLRMGYAVAHPEQLKRWQQWRDPWSVNSLAAAATVAVLNDKAFQQRTWDWLTAARSQLSTGLDRITGLTSFSAAANFLLVHCQTSVTQLQQHLLQQHQILIRDCLSFPELGDHYFRVAVRTVEQNQRLLAALETALGASD